MMEDGEEYKYKVGVAGVDEKNANANLVLPFCWNFSIKHNCGSNTTKRWPDCSSSIIALWWFAPRPRRHVCLLMELEETEGLAMRETVHVRFLWWITTLSLSLVRASDDWAPPRPIH